MSALGEYLRAESLRPWGYGTGRDCCTFVADWCVSVGYPDPMAFIRGRYANEAEALAHVRKSGLLRLARRGFESIGLERTKAPTCGDVAIIKRPMLDGSEAVCAIKSGDRWAIPLERGISIDEGGDLLAAWRVEWAKQ